MRVAVRKITLAAMLITAMACMSACSGSPAGISSPALVSSVTVFMPDYSKNDGRVSEAVRYSWMPSEDSDEGRWEDEYRYEFEYTDTAISGARYASMINYFLLDEGGNYYIFNWF